MVVFCEPIIKIDDQILEDDDLVQKRLLLPISGSIDPSDYDRALCCANDDNKYIYDHWKRKGDWFYRWVGKEEVFVYNETDEPLRY
jgi:hypothetical protein